MSLELVMTVYASSTPLIFCVHRFLGSLVLAVASCGAGLTRFKLRLIFYMIVGFESSLASIASLYRSNTEYHALWVV